jgi:hypothetical protein
MKDFLVSTGTRLFVYSLTALTVARALANSDWGVVTLNVCFVIDIWIGELRKR